MPANGEETYSETNRSGDDDAKQEKEYHRDPIAVAPGDTPIGVGGGDGPVYQEEKNKEHHHRKHHHKEFTGGLYTGVYIQFDPNIYQKVEGEMKFVSKDLNINGLDIDDDDVDPSSYNPKPKNVDVYCRGIHGNVTLTIMGNP